MVWNVGHESLMFLLSDWRTLRDLMQSKTASLRYARDTVFSAGRVVQDVSGMQGIVCEFDRHLMDEDTVRVRPSSGGTMLIPMERLVVVEDQNLWEPWIKKAKLL